ncbi:MAG: leucine-rich repeat protein [Clostridia bacterium]|nr:leucine-rich repeat protein [Clostridia bacterium]
MKRFLCVIITLSVLMTSFMTFGVFADYEAAEENEAVTINGIEYVPYETFCSVEDCSTDLSGDVVIESSVEFNGTELPVTTIGSWAFEYCEKITSVTVPDSVNCINAGAFSDCHNLKSIKLPAALESIEYYLFNCCYALEEFTVPEGITSIGGNAFFGCNNLVKVVLPDSLTAIYENAFQDCDKLESISIPKNVEFIGELAFSDCDSFTAYSVDKNNKLFCDVDGVLFSKDKKTLLSFPCGRGTEYTVSDNVTEIGDYAFYSCFTLEKVNLPEGLQKIDRFAFFCSSNIESIDIPASVKEISTGAFANCSAMKTINVSKDSASFASEDGVLFSKDMTELISFPMASEILNYTVPESVLSIADYGFYNCYNLTDLILPANLAEIGENVFVFLDNVPLNEYKNGLYLRSKNNSYIVLVNVADNTCTSFEINENTKFISTDAFLDCDMLKEITVPESVVSIGDFAFYNCSDLEKVKLGKNINKIGIYAFSWCNSLEEINIPEGVTEIKDSTFSGCYSITDLTLPEGITLIGEYAFGWCYGLSSITLPSTLKEIDYAAFEGCYELKTVYFNGTKDQGQKIDIGTYNDPLLEALIVYSCGDLPAGDCNSDGAVDNKDVVVLFRYVSGGEKAPDETVYDYNGDKEVNNKDVVELFRYVSSK